MINLLNKKLFLFIIIFLSFIFRFYNLNFEDLWFDEIISFYIVNPKVDLVENFSRHYDLDVAPFFYHLILKYFFLIFGYETYNGRILSCLTSFISIFILAKSSNYLKASQAYGLIIFLFGFNIFLISYAQEMRVYSILFFFSALNYLFFLKCLKEKNNINVCIFLFLALINCLLSPFAILITLSFIIYICLYFFKNKFFYNKIFYGLILVVFIVFCHYLLHFFYLYNSNFHNIQNFWIPDIKIKFFTNFFFSNFFGSRILGLIFLITLIYLIFLEKKIFSKFNQISIFLISLITIYSVSIFFSLFFQSIMVPRYFIHVIIPIIILLSYLTAKNKYKNLKNFILSLLILSTVFNLFTEQTFKQFYKHRSPSKPEYTKLIKIINKSGFANYSLDVNWPTDSKQIVVKAINNYLNFLAKKNNINLNYLNNFEKNTEKYFWLICPLDFQSDCLDSKYLKNHILIKNIYLNRINIKLYNIYDK